LPSSPYNFFKIFCPQTHKASPVSRGISPSTPQSVSRRIPPGQSHAGETTLGHLTQKLGLTVQNFVSAATGIAALLALIRGFVRTSEELVGNFWADLIRSTLYVLLPLFIVLAHFLGSEGCGAGILRFSSPRHS
jgi:hypothetical protein